MRHINYGNDKTRTERTPMEWLPIGAQIGELVNRWSDRSDLLVFIGEGATDGIASAIFRPDISEVEINTKIAFGELTTPEHIGDIRERNAQYEFPAGVGMMRHEALHARFSQWDMAEARADLAPDVFSALTTLEESRIEAHGVRLDRKHRPFLRACALQVVIGDIAEAEGQVLGRAESAVSLMGLVAGRVIAGVLSPEDVATLLDLVKTEVGEDNYARMSEILFAVHAHSNHKDLHAIYPLAEEWANILRELKGPEDENEGEGAEGAGAGAGTKEQSEGDAKFMKAVMDALSDAAMDVAIANARDLADQQESEEWRDAVEASKQDTAEQQQNEEIAQKIFGKSTAEMVKTRTHSRLLRSRAPKDVERVAAVTVARMLEKAKYRERDTTVVSSVVPAGRLRPRAMVQAAAQRAAGRVPNVEPWRRKVHKHTDEPTLSVGVMVDISGSMGPAMESMATTAWVMSEATRRIQGRAAMVYYGNDVFPTLRAGEHLTQVEVYSAQDGTEMFDMAFRALDGTLDMLHSDGARLLVVVSDGHYTMNERTAASKWMKRCRQAGVGVLWLTFDGVGNDATGICEGTDVVIVSDRMEPAAAASSIGRAAASAMEAVGRRNA